MVFIAFPVRERCHCSAPLCITSLCIPRLHSLCHVRTCYMPQSARCILLISCFRRCFSVARSFAYVRVRTCSAVLAVNVLCVRVFVAARQCNVNSLVPISRLITSPFPSHRSYDFKDYDGHSTALGSIILLICVFNLSPWTSVCELMRCLIDFDSTWEMKNEFDLAGYTLYSRVSNLCEIVNLVR